MGEQNALLGQVVSHDQIKAKVVRCLPSLDFGSHGQACRIDPQMDLGREVEGGPENDPVDRFPTRRSRAAETLARDTIIPFVNTP